MCHFFTVAVIVKDGEEFFSWMILRYVTVIKVVTNFFLDRGTNRMTVGLVLETVALAKVRWWVCDVKC